MAWDEQKARRATQDFYSFWEGFKKQHPKEAQDIKDMWNGCYLTCGHKRLAAAIIDRPIEKTYKDFGGE
jgi:hypothetical protein